MRRALSPESSRPLLCPICGKAGMSALSESRTIAHGLTTVAPSIRVSVDPSPAACEEYVVAHPEGAPYHRPAWMGIIRRTFGHTTRYLVAESASRVVGVLPLVLFDTRLFGRFGVSIPFFNYGGALADSQQAEHALLTSAIEETKRAGGLYLELRHTRQLFPELAAKRHKVAMMLPLESTSDRQWQTLDRKVRNQVRKAEKNGLEVQEGGLELVRGFYTVFARNMRDLGTPVYGIRLFEEVLSTFPDCSRVFIVRLAGRPIAASVALWHGTTMEVPWASAIRTFNALCGNMLLYWHMIRFAIERGFRIFDFGRSTVGGGTFQFKRQWGAEPRPLVWEYWTADDRQLPDLSPANSKFRLAVRAWRYLPVPVATAIGPLIVRNIP